MFDFIDTVFPTAVWREHDEELQRVATLIIGEEEAEELAGIVDAIKTHTGHDIPLSELEFLQIFYEVLMECTGVLARDDKGGIYHGRNMDFVSFPLANVTAQVNWLKNGRPLFASTQYLGYAGVHTGMRIGGWSVQANERIVLAPGPKIGFQKGILLETVTAFLEGHQPIGKTLRGALTNASTFEEALPLLEHIPLASPVCRKAPSPPLLIRP